MRQVLVMTLLAFAATLAEARAPQRLEPKDLLVLEGDGYALGHKQGVAIKEDIKVLYDEWLVPKLRTVPLLIEIYAKAKAHNMEPFIPQEFKDEIRGLTEAVGIDYDMGLIVNAVPDIMELFRKPFGCSTFVTLPARSASGGLIYGRNLDYGMSDVLRSHWQPTVFAKPGKHRILSINVPGMTGVLTAINDKGVMMSRMTSYNKDIRSHGIPSMILFRQILETADTAEEAAEMYRRATRTVAVNVMITDANDALVVESTATRFEIRRPNDAGVLYAANHFETPELKDRFHDRDERWPHLARFDHQTQKITAADVLETMALSAGEEHKNVLAAVVDYGKKTLVYGSDAEGNGASARGALFEIDLTEALPGF